MPRADAPTFKCAEWRIRFLRQRADSALASCNFRRAALLEAEADREEAKLKRTKAGMN